MKKLRDSKIDYLHRQMLTQEIINFVNEQKLGYVATVCPDGTPNLSPKGTVLAWDEEHLVFADIHSPGTSNNLQKNPSIEVNVVDIFSRKGYRFKGSAQVFSNGKIFDDVVAKYRAVGSRHVIQNIVFIKIHRVLPLSSPAYDTGLTEAEIRQRWIEYWKSKNS